MKNFMLDLEDELHTKVKIKAIRQGETMHNFIVRAVEKSVLPHTQGGDWEKYYKKKEMI